MMIKYGTGRACVTTGTYGTFRTCGTKWTKATFLLIFNVNSNSFDDSKYAEHFRKKIIHKEQLWNRAWKEYVEPVEHMVHWEHVELIKHMQNVFKVQ